jgi:hypothetical protein
MIHKVYYHKGGIITKSVKFVNKTPTQDGFFIKEYIVNDTVNMTVNSFKSGIIQGGQFQKDKLLQLTYNGEQVHDFEDLGKYSTFEEEVHKNIEYIIIENNMPLILYDVDTRNYFNIEWELIKNFLHKKVSYIIEILKLEILTKYNYNKHMILHEFKHNSSDVEVLEKSLNDIIIENIREDNIIITYKKINLNDVSPIVRLFKYPILKEPYHVYRMNYHDRYNEGVEKEVLTVDNPTDGKQIILRNGKGDKIPIPDDRLYNYIDVNLYNELVQPIINMWLSKYVYKYICGTDIEQTDYDKRGIMKTIWSNYYKLIKRGISPLQQSIIKTFLCRRLEYHNMIDYGYFSPITTQSAEVFFDKIDMSKDLTDRDTFKLPMETIRSHTNSVIFEIIYIRRHKKLTDLIQLAKDGEPYSEWVDVGKRVSGEVSLYSKIINILEISNKFMGKDTTDVQKTDEVLNLFEINGSNIVYLDQITKGVCIDKSILFKFLCDQVGIQCKLISGFVNQELPSACEGTKTCRPCRTNHAWNIVTDGDQQYLIDVRNNETPIQNLSEAPLFYKKFQALDASTVGDVGFTRLPSGSDEQFPVFMQRRTRELLDEHARFFV